MQKILCYLIVVCALSRLEGNESNMKSDLAFKTIPYDSPDYKVAIVLRKETLQKPEEFVCQKEEINYVHVAGYLDGELCASAVLIPENGFIKMQRVVVKNELQHQGIGSSLLKYCEEYARDYYFREIYCYSRLETISFYLKNGYQISGDITYKNDIPHQKMTKLVQ